MDLWGSWRGMEGIGGKKGSKTIYSHVFNFNNFQKGSIEQQQHPVQDCLVYLGNPNHCVECLLLCPWHLLPRLFIQTFEEAIATFYSSFVCIAFSPTCTRNSLGEIFYVTALLCCTESTQTVWDWVVLYFLEEKKGHGMVQLFTEDLDERSKRCWNSN